MAFQAKLLRAIQEKEIRRVGDNRPVTVDVRVIAATNQDLQRAIEEKRFRQDLYYRLNVVRFRLPPLNERLEDIPLLVEHFLKKFSRSMGRTVRLGPGVMEQLLTYPFPGNVRELENVIEQGVALTVDGVMRVSDLSLGEEQGPPQPETLEEIVAAAERRGIQMALGQQPSMEKAAQTLGLSSTTLWRKMKKLGIQNPHRRR
jgi:two-component system response regulator HydG